MATSVYARSLGIGAVAGLRSMTAPAATLLAGDRPFAGLAILAGAGELIVDKLPVAPARTIPPAVAVRMLAGGFSGGAIAARFGGSRVLGIVLGALGAVAVTYLAYDVRRRLTKDAGLPDAAVALAEDALAIWAARAANQPVR